MKFLLRGFIMHAIQVLDYTGVWRDAEVQLSSIVDKTKVLVKFKNCNRKYAHEFEKGILYIIFIISRDDFNFL